MNIKGEFSNWLYKRDIGFLMSEDGGLLDLPDFNVDNDIDDPSPSSDPKKAKEKAERAEADAKRRRASDESQKQQQQAQQPQPQSKPQSQSQSQPPQPPQPQPPQPQPKPRPRQSQPKNDTISQWEKHFEKDKEKLNLINNQTPAQPAPRLQSRQPTQTTQPNRGNSPSPFISTPSSTNQNIFQPSPSPSRSSSRSQQLTDMGGKVRPASDYRDPFGR